MYPRIDPKTATLPQAKRCAVRDAAACSRGVCARASGPRHDARVAGAHRDLPAHAVDERLPSEGGRS